MRTLRFYLSMVMALSLIMGCLTCLTLTTAAADAPEFVKDGLVAWYDGSNNSNGEQNYETTLWRDLSGNKNHFSVRLNETNYWKDNAFHLDSESFYFPEALVDVINSEAYTIEFSAGELDLKATDWITLMCSDNDEFSLFIRVPQEDDDRDELEYKYNDKNQDRPKVDDGAAALESDGIGSTIAITFDMNAEGGPVCIIYINGTEAGRGVPEHTNIADTLTIGHNNPQRAWAADMYSIRFYNRALTPAEVSDNAEADDEKYRFGINYPPVVEYDDSDEVFADSVTGDFSNNVIPLLPELGLVSTEGFYGATSIETELYGDWTGVRVAPTEQKTLDSAGAALPPAFYINYSKFCRMAGLTMATGEEAPYVVAKLRVESGKPGDVTLWGMSGDLYSWFEEGAANASALNDIDANGEVEYLIYDLEYSWEGSINMLRLSFDNAEVGSVIYVEEIRLFTNKEEAYAYAGEEIPTRAPETEKPTEDKTEAPDENKTEAPTTDVIDDEEKGGCKSVVSASVVAIVAAAAAFVALKKKD